MLHCGIREGVEHRKHKGPYRAGPAPAGTGGRVAGAERAARTASVIPQPGQSSAAILRRQARGSQHAAFRGGVQRREWDGLLMRVGGRAQVGRRRGRPRRVRRVEQAQAREDLAHLPRLVLRPEDAVLDKMRPAVPGATA
jgi:hypothetical protein